MTGGGGWKWREERLKEKEEEGRKDRRVKCLSRIGQRRETVEGDRGGRQRRETEEGDKGGGRKNPGPLHMWWRTCYYHPQQ